MPTQYCSQCEPGNGCCNYHIYVIELRREVLVEKPDFPYSGRLPDDKRVYYVGQTAHSPECRFFQHTAERPPNRMYDCTCNLGVNPSNERKQRKFPKKVKFVFGYVIKLLELSDHNPSVRTDGFAFPGSATAQKSEALEIEKACGEALRLQGHAVYWN